VNGLGCFVSVGGICDLWGYVENAPGGGSRRIRKECKCSVSRGEGVRFGGVNVNGLGCFASVGQNRVGVKTDEGYIVRIASG
jgi:hypothetical protein